MLYATEGTLIACEIANRMKWSINLSGGYHHASTSTGGGFCVFPDITLAVHYIRTRMNKNKIMIIDLDAHQGNGYERDFLKDDNVFIVDSYNPNIYPKDEVAKKAINLLLPVANYTSDEDYLTSLKRI
jgi:histone deacetylase 11